MRNSTKKNVQIGVTVMVFFAFMLFSTMIHAVTTPEINNCPGPSVSVSSRTSSSVTFGWGAVGDATSYKVWYVRADNGQRSADFTTTGTSITCPGLSSGQHTFYFVTVCGNGESEIIYDVIII